MLIMPILLALSHAHVKTAFMPMVKNVMTPTNALPTISAQLRQTVSINFEHICLVVRLVTLVTV